MSEDEKKDKVDQWIDRHEQAVKYAYVIWCVGVISVAVAWGLGYFDNWEFDIPLDFDDIPTGFMDKEPVWYMPTCPKGTIAKITEDEYGSKQTCLDAITEKELECGVNTLSTGHNVTIGCVIP